MTWASAHLHWTFDICNPVIAPGQLAGAHDAMRTAAPHIIQVGNRYRMYYWGTDADGYHRILQAESPIHRPNDWEFQGIVLERQPETDYNHFGPGFPFVLTSERGPWFLYFGAWGKPRADGKLPNTTGLAVSEDDGETWHYVSERPILPLDQPWDCEGTGSVCVLRLNGQYHMYYTAIGPYFERPAGVQTGHGDVIPRIGVGYATSTNGVHWHKPLDDLMIAPRGFATEPYEYICSKPFITPTPDGYHMWVNTFGPAYRLRSLTSADGIQWTWQPSGPDGEFGVGAPGAFDDRQRCYISVINHNHTCRGWYTGNGFGATGIGYATATFEDER